MCELAAERGPDITYRATNIVAVVGNGLTSNKGHADKMVLIRGVQIINCHIHNNAMSRNILFNGRCIVGQI